jgi:hypothetical protein
MGCYRTVFHENYLYEALLFMTVLDGLVLILGIRYLNNRIVLIVLFLLIISMIVGLFNGNEISRRYITDMTNPLFFFGKIYIFSKYWKVHCFSKYIKYYAIVAVIGSILLLPITYFLFHSNSHSRLAIFPPMELPFANYLFTNSITLMLVSLLVIILYGKRAQLVGAIMVLLYSIIITKKNRLKVLFLICLSSILIVFVFDRFSDNIAISRVQNTIDKYIESGNIESIDSGRSEEIKRVMEDMDSLSDYIFGKGVGYTYQLGENKKHANCHFSPIGFLSKYGIVFTLFIYAYFIMLFKKKHKKHLDHLYKTALGVVYFVFIESFFAYAIFVTLILPVAISYIKYVQNEKDIFRL